MVLRVDVGVDFDAYVEIDVHVEAGVDADFDG